MTKPKAAKQTTTPTILMYFTPQHTLEHSEATQTKSSSWINWTSHENDKE